MTDVKEAGILLNFHFLEWLYGEEEYPKIRNFYSSETSYLTRITKSRVRGINKQKKRGNLSKKPLFLILIELKCGQYFFHKFGINSTPAEFRPIQ